MSSLSPSEMPLKRRGFTLIELLVSITVLSLLVAMLGVVVSVTSQAISTNTRKLDAAGQARVVFDRLAVDLGARIRRSDVSVAFNVATGNDNFQFYSQVDGYKGLRQVAEVGYRIQQTTPARLYQLERGAVGTDWETTLQANPFVQFLPNSPVIATDGDPNYDVLAPGVFRLEICFVLNNGVLGDTSTTNLSNITGVVVALGVLDNNSRKVLTTGQLAQLSGFLPDTVTVSGTVKDPLSTWNAAVQQSSFAPGLPREAAQSVRLYERTFYVR